jgi:hypothetical protein
MYSSLFHQNMYQQYMVLKLSELPVNAGRIRRSCRCIQVESDNRLVAHALEADWRHEISYSCRHLGRHPGREQAGSNTAVTNFRPQLGAEKYSKKQITK